MALLTKKEFAELAGLQGSRCVSIFIPTHRTGQEVTGQQDKILFKNQLSAIEKEMKSRDLFTVGCLGSKNNKIRVKEVRLFVAPPYFFNLSKNALTPDLKFLKLPLAPSVLMYLVLCSGTISCPGRESV